MEVANLTVEEGEKAFGRQLVTEFADGTPVEIPVAVIRGKQSGPRFHVQACSHGYEITGLEIARELMRQIDPAHLSGTVTFAPIANLPAYLTRSYTFAHEERFPGHPIDMLKYLPGTPDGFLTERIANFLWEELITQSDYTIDLHTGAGGSDIASMCYTTANWGEELAAAAGAEFIIPFDQLRGVTVYKPRIFPTETWVSIAEEEHAVKATLLEMGEGGRITWDKVPVGVNGILNVMSEIGMWNQDVERIHEPRLIENIVAVQNDKGGTINLKIEAGESLKKGQLLAEISNPFDVVEEVRAPVDGHALRVMVGKQILYPGAEIAWIAET